jgi:transposase-like protein
VIFSEEVAMPGRKVRDESEARRFLEAVARSGLERAAWARQHGINARSLNAWRLVLARKDRADQRSPLEFLELVPTPGADRSPGPLALRVGEMCIDVPADFDDDHLHRVLRVVLAAAC